MDPNDGKLQLDLADNAQEHFEVKHNAHRQIADWAKIPAAYYDRMPTDLRAVNVNHWLNNEPGQRMVRTLDGQVRAFMSDRYRVLDNFDLATAILPILQEVPDMDVISTELTENRMYIKALFPRIEREVKRGDVVQSGVVISNSEVGKGSLRVEPLVYRLVCLNGMISNISQKKYHIGKAAGEADAAMEIYRDETLQADDRAFWLKVQDTVRASVDHVQFNKIVDDMARTVDLGFEVGPQEVIERTAKKFSLTDGESQSVLTHLIEGGDLNGFGLLNALTRTSQDVEDYDRATEFERMGGQIIELNPSQWSEIAAAA